MNKTLKLVGSIFGGLFWGIVGAFVMFMLLGAIFASSNMEIHSEETQQMIIYLMIGCVIAMFLATTVAVSISLYKNWDKDDTLDMYTRRRIL